MTLSDLTFAHPGAFALLALLPLLLVPRARRGGTPALRVGSTAVAEAVGTPSRHRLGLSWPPLLRAAAVVSLVVALARPQLGFTTTEVEASGVDILLGVDVSSSMLAEDLDRPGVNRLDVVKDVLDRFITARPNDRIGLIAFAGDPWLVSPLTLDHDWLRDTLDRVSIGMVADGTAIGSAIASGTARLQDTDARSRILVLLTDGANNAGSVQPALAAEAAAALGVKVHAIGVGAAELTPVVVTDADGQRRTVDLAVETTALQAIAETTGGLFFLASDAAGLAEVYDRIDALETTTRSVAETHHVRELFAVPGGLASLFLALELLALGLGRLRIP